jgi:integrase
MFKWGAARKLIPVAIYQELTTVEGLRTGRTAAPETEPVKPVPESFVEATLPCLLPQVRAMVQLQLLSGMRPGEVVIMRTIDIDTAGKVWLYRPGSDQGPHGTHKTAWRGQDRIIALGPKAQEVLRPWMRLNLHEYLFQPAEAVASWRAEQRKRRKSAVQPSQVCRKKAKPKRKPGSRYTVRAYGTAVARGCEKAGVPHWSPLQLRHTKATEIRREAGLDIARAVLGHRSPQVTEVYAEIDMNKAAEVMEKLG